MLTFDKDEITIGRVSGNDIVLAKGNISKRHTRLTKRDGGMEIADLKSTNGTYVNGRKIAGPTDVAPSDRIYVGDFLIGLDGPGAAVAEPGGLHSRERARPARRAGFPSRRRPRRPRAAGRARRAFPTRETSVGGDDEEESSWRRARRARAGRSRRHRRPPPPARRPTPMASASLGLDDEEEEPFADGPPIEMNQPSEDTGNVGLFQHTRRAADDESDAVSRRAGTETAPDGRRRGPAGARVRRRDRPGRDRRADATRRRRGARPRDVARRSGGHADPDHRPGRGAGRSQGSGLSLHDGNLGDSNAVADVLWRYANNAYPPPPPDNPVVDVRLPDGTRVSAAFPPAAPGRRGGVDPPDGAARAGHGRSRARRETRTCRRCWTRWSRGAATCW